MSSWDTDGSRAALAEGYTYEIAAICKVCYRSLQLYTAEGQRVFLDFLPSKAKAVTDGETTWVADYDKLTAVQKSGELFARQEDFGQEVKAITSDTNPYVYVGFEDQFVRAYNQVPARVKAGNVGEDIADLLLDIDGNVIVLGKTSTGFSLASWTSDLNTENWRVTRSTGFPSSMTLDFLSNTIFVGAYSNAHIHRFDASGNELGEWEPQANCTDITCDGRRVYSYGGDGYVEAYEYDGTQVFRYEAGGLGGQVAVTPRWDLRNNFDVTPHGEEGYMYVSAYGRQLKKVYLGNFEELWSVSAPVEQMSAYPGPAGSTWWKEFLLLSTATQRGPANVQVGLGQGMHYPIVVIIEDAEGNIVEWIDSSDVQVGMGNGLYSPNTISISTQTDTSDAQVTMGDGEHYAVTIVIATQDDTSDAQVTMSTGLYDQAIVEAQDDNDPMDAQVSIGSGSYVSA